MDFQNKYLSLTYTAMQSKNWVTVGQQEGNEKQHMHNAESRKVTSLK